MGCCIVSARTVRCARRFPADAEVCLLAGVWRDRHGVLVRDSESISRGHLCKLQWAVTAVWRDIRL